MRPLSDINQFYFEETKAQRGQIISIRPQKYQDADAGFKPGELYPRDQDLNQHTWTTPLSEAESKTKQKTLESTAVHKFLLCVILSTSLYQ